MQIKTIMTYHLMLVRLAIIKKSTNNKWWKKVWGSGRDAGARRTRLSDPAGEKTKRHGYTSTIRGLGKKLELGETPKIT